MIRYALLLVLALPGAAFAGGAGIEHATEWVWWRDGGRLVNGLILIAGLYWVIKRFIIPALKERTEGIARGLEEAENLRMDTMKKLSDLEYKIRQFEKETAGMRADAGEEGRRVAERMMAEAKDAAKKILEKAKKEIDNETLMAKEALRRETVELSVKLAKEILQKNLSETDDKVIFDEYLGGIKRLQ